MPLLLTIDGTDRRTDARPFHRPCSTLLCGQCQLLDGVKRDIWCGCAVCFQFDLAQLRDVGLCDPIRHMSSHCSVANCYTPDLLLSVVTVLPFSALTLLVWSQEEHPVCKNYRCCCCSLSEARCRLFAYGPADATAIPKPHHLLPHSNPDWFYFSGTDLPRLSWKRGR